MQQLLGRVNFETADNIHDEQQTSFLCPLNIRNSFIARMSNTDTAWSREAAATKSPLGDHATAWIVFLCWCLGINEQFGVTATTFLTGSKGRYLYEGPRI